MQVEGKGIIAIKTLQGDVKLFYDVQFVPSLAHNLLSVGQLMISGYKVVFDGNSCVVNDKKSGKTITNVHMTQNKMFPLDVSNVVSKALIVRGNNEAKLWHLHFGHLNVNSLKLLSYKKWSLACQKLVNLFFCEECVYGKQSRRSFLVGKS